MKKRECGRGKKEEGERRNLLRERRNIVGKVDAPCKYGLPTGGKRNIQ